ncbi:MAG TPA: helix-turn-helix domain-containing protein, partial [Polyangiaceae bacterium]|nr:helix-turn-helix domain-containing protein [Polyangiaceae bacterium]
GVAAEASTDRVIEALRLSGGNRTRAARMLSIGRATLYRRLHELELERRAHGNGEVAPPSLSSWPAR